MSGRFHQSNGMIIVAVQFDLLGRTLINCACDLARRAKLSVRVVHVIEPSRFEGLVGEALNFSQALEFVSDQYSEMTKRRLDDFVKKAEPSFLVDTKLLKGDAAFAIAAEAAHARVSCVIVGAALKSHRFVPRGFSTALSLMSTCSVPVMVMSSDAMLDARREDLHVLIADDLQDQSIEAVSTAFDLASLFSDACVEQVHVSTLTREVLEEAVIAASSAARQAVPAPDTVLTVFHGYVGKLQELLKQRAGSGDIERQQGIRYSHEVRVGVVMDELDSAVKEKSPDLIVYGRHQTFHKPFGLGQVPFYSILGQQAPIMVVPPRIHQL